MQTWIKVVNIEEIPYMGSRKVVFEQKEIAIFKTRDGSIFAINNTCPHKQGKLSEGLVHENVVTCPLHNLDINLENGEVLGEDCGCSSVYETKIDKSIVYIKL